MRALFLFAVVIASVQIAKAEDAAPSRIDAITKSARDMMPTVPSLPSLSLPTMPDLSMPDFSDTSGRIMTEFNSFMQQISDTQPILEEMGFEVVTFKVTWGLPPRAKLRLRSKGNNDMIKVTAIASKAPSGGMLANALISSAVTAKRIQSSMKLGTAILDVDFAVPPKVNMKFVNAKSTDKDDGTRDADELEVSCK